MRFLLLACVAGAVAGAAASSTFELTIHLQPRDRTALERLFWRVSNPDQPEYLHFRSVPELAELAGATDEAVQSALEWLTSLGGKNILISKMRDSVTATFSEAAMNHRLWSEHGLPRSANQPPAIQLVTRRDFKPTVLPEWASNVSKLNSKTQASYTIANQKNAYGVPLDLAASNPLTTQMVWGPGTFGYSPLVLAAFKSSQCPGMNLDKIHFDTENHGSPGGDNFLEGSLDVRMIASFGMNSTTLVSNTNTSMSTEEGDGFGLAFLDFVTELAARPTVPQVLSLSLGSLSAYSCDLLCEEASKEPDVTLEACKAYLQTQRQVCMFTSTAQVNKINDALMLLGLRGVSVFGASGDGGSHWSFGPFRGFGTIPTALNKVGCEYQFPIFPSPSPYMVSIGATEWKYSNPNNPIMWPGSGGGFAWQFARPDHQQDGVEAYLASVSLPPASSFNRTGRGYPDISAVGTQGTSESSPTVAGIFSLIIDARLNAGLPPLGFVAPRIWSVASNYPGEAFEDVTEGNSAVDCSTDTGFPAAAGWDPTTGWGRPIWKGMLQHFAQDPVKA